MIVTQFIRQSCALYMEIIGEWIRFVCEDTKREVMMTSEACGLSCIHCKLFESVGHVYTAAYEASLVE